MKVLWALAAAFAIVGAGWAGTLGSFAGIVVVGPPEPGHWLYVEGHDHGIRRVNVTAARIHYGSDVPADARREPIPDVLPAGTYIRVHAEQGPDGEWHAAEIEILEPPTDRKNNEKKIGSPVTATS